MTLYLIGLGLDGERSLTIQAVEGIKLCSKVFVERYTNIITIDEKRFRELTGMDFELVDREFVEDAEKIVKMAADENVAILISGDPLSATTHFELYMEAKNRKVPVVVSHNASVFTAISKTGLQLYKFGATASIPLPEENYAPESFYDIFIKNHKLGYHTLFLIDPQEKGGKRLTIQKALENLRIIDHRRERLITDETKVIACASLGTDNEKIVYATAQELASQVFKGPICLIVTGSLHFREEDGLALYEQ